MDLENIPDQCDEINISGNVPLESFPQIANSLQCHKNIRLHVGVDYKENIKNLDFLEDFTFINSFGINALYSLKNLDGLKFLPKSLETLNLSLVEKRKIPLESIVHLKNLSSLNLENVNNSIEETGILENVSTLSLRSCIIPDFSKASFRNLKNLEIRLGNIQNIQTISVLKNLQYLELWMVKNLDSLSFIKDMKNLQFIFLQSLKHIMSLDPLQNLPALRRIYLEDMKGISSLNDLIYSKSLVDLICVNMKHLNPESFFCLKNHPTLKYVSAGLGSIKNNTQVADIFAPYEYYPFEYLN